MILERFEVKGLSHYSYICGCDGTKKVAVIDPERNVGQYIEFARLSGLTITYVLETHIHADYASGAKELAKLSGAALCLSAYDKQELYSVSFPHTELHDGTLLPLGSLTLKALHTPGHTPEHLSFLVFNSGISPDTPEALFSGDFLFVGSVGRPDLLGEASKQKLAHQLRHSIREKLSALPDSVKIYPAHGSGSLCGAGMGGSASSTLGAERFTNPYLSESLTEAEFVTKLLSSAPPLPPYYKRMKELNSNGPAPLQSISEIKALTVTDFVQCMNENAAVIDARDQLAFGNGHIPGSFGIGSGDSFTPWAAWIIPYDVPILLVAPSDDAIQKLYYACARVGLDNVKGYLKDGFESWRSAEKEIASLPQISPQQLSDRLKQNEKIQVLDVRQPNEWNAGHITGAIHITLHELAARASELRDISVPIAVTCAGGYRSTIAASILLRAGITNIANITGGMNAWQKEGKC